MRCQGGKSRMAKHIVPILRDLRGDAHYVEPFIGGANIFHLMDSPKTGSDIDEDVAILWEAVTRGWLPPDMTIGPEEYKSLKEEPQSPLRSLVAFGAAWGGIKWSKFARGLTRAGAVRDFYTEARNVIYRQSPGLKGAEILHRSYLEIDPEKLSRDHGESLVYCDPPYAGTLGYKTGKFDHTKFWSWVREMSRLHAVVVSEYSAPEDFVSIYSKARTQGINNQSRVEHLWVPR